MSNIKSKWKTVWIPEMKHAIDEFRNPKTRYRQIPNMLTASRLISPIIIIPVALCTNVIITFIVASLFALTDALDGKIARTYNLQSNLGTMLDPITDKVFAFALLLPNIIIFPITICSIFVLEGTIGIINACSAFKGNQPHSNMLGKTKTTFVFITAIAMYLSNISFVKLMLPFLISITILLLVSTAITYKIIDLKKEQKKRKSK